MSQRQRRRKDQRRKQAERRGPSRRQITAGASIAMGAALATTGSAQAATFTVSNLNDSGAGSLRQAVTDANSNGAGSDDVVFASGLSGTIDIGTFNGDGLYPETPMNIQGPGAGQITLRGVNNIDYVVFTDGDPFYGASPGAPITISGVTITGGNADNSVYTNEGGGIYNRDAALSLSRTVISGNHAEENGGGIYSASNAGGSLTLNNTTVGNNTGGSADFSVYGGGIFSGAPTVIRTSTISGNSIGSDGPGVYMTNDAPLTIENSTIANNIATGSGSDVEGGGVWVTGGSLDIKSSTITGNSVGGSKGQGGGVYTSLDSSAVHIQNTIIANNHGTQGNDLYLDGGGQIGFSLIKDPSDSGTPPFSSTGPNITGVDPQLGGLASNGGPTLTEAPSAGSPVIDKGAAFGLTSDQRGVLRPIDFPSIPNTAGGDGSDIGAFELQPDNAFKLGKLKRNKKKGNGKQIVFLPLPDAGSVTIKGKGMKTKTVKVQDNGKLKLPVVPKGKKRKQENRTGKVKLKAKITYNATGNAAKTLNRKLKLLKKR